MRLVLPSSAASILRSIFLLLNPPQNSSWASSIAPARYSVSLRRSVNLRTVENGSDALEIALARTPELALEGGGGGPAVQPFHLH
jgi:hypothetical protein